MKHHGLQVIAPETEIYGNWKVYSPDDQLMMRCSTKKANWYLSRNLAEKIGELTIKINFKPNGMGHATDYHGYYLEERKVLCVCCGTDNNLTRHHVVPYCYRRFFPDIYKDHSSFDVVLLCEYCHSKYETYSTELQKQILNECNYTLDPIVREHNRLIGTAGSALNALKYCSEKIPAERRAVLLATLTEYYNRPVSFEEVSSLEIEKLQPQKDRTAYVVSQIQQPIEFIVRWRKHFVEHAKPQYLSKSWLDHYETVVR